ncbi:hypothetical protein JQK88_34600 [Mesorhizobium caraganae]|uniref:hypothetical protein n=1 Tax=Mesorhizobium caraganae TaxID=483206 RepID=UPI00193A2458|nr:hypothetical protein [Mesorhizobium caraganae]
MPSNANVRRVNSEAGRAELAASIEAHGLIHNLVTRKRWRWRAVSWVSPTGARCRSRPGW